MDNEEIFNYNYALRTCYHERVKFIKCMQLNITEQNTREKKEKKCKEFFDKYISCMKANDTTINYMS